MLSRNKRPTKDKKYFIPFDPKIYELGYQPSNRKGSKTND